MSAPIVKSEQIGSGVALILVSHDGATWLPAVLDGIATQTASIEAMVAVDTGSRDESVALIGAALTRMRPHLDAADSVVQTAAGTSFPAAVDLGVTRLAELGAESEWIWLLHDDARPDPGALSALLQAAQDHPEADILGPKLREWPSLRRLLEIGVTISGTGRRETGLERGEYDQGQHGEVREVLAVHSAGMLIRRRTFAELGGFDTQLPIFGNDIDLGWQAAAVGRTTLVVPGAVVFHAEAAHRGVRRTSLTGRHTHFQERRAALYTLLVNVRRNALPFQLLRIVVGSLIRMLGFLVVRAPGEALDELAALLSIATKPRLIHGARRMRRDRLARLRGDEGADRRRVKRLLAPWWLPYRHGLDFFGDLASAATNQASDVAERRREAAAEREPARPVARHSVEEDEFADSGIVVRFLTDPIAIGIAVVLLALVVGARTGLVQVPGDVLSPVPAGRSEWWSLHLQGWHALGFGSTLPAPAYVLPLALFGTLLGPDLALTLVLVAAAPFALWGAWRFLRVVGRLATPYGAPRWLLLWGATSYAVLAPAAAVLASGHWGLLAAAAVLPWAAHAALGFADPEPARRWRAAWRTGLLLALLSAFAPTMWLLCFSIAVVVLGGAWLLVGTRIRTVAAWGPPAAGLAVPIVVLLPWWLPALWGGGGAALVLDVGQWPTSAIGGWDLLAGRLGETGAPVWLGWILPVLALAALLPRASRPAVVVCWLVAAIVSLIALPLGLIRIELPGAADQQPGLGVFLLLLHGAWITAVLLGALGLRGVHLPRLARVSVVALAFAALIMPVGVLAWTVVDGGPDAGGPDATAGVPVYMRQAAEASDAAGILVLRGSASVGLTYDVIRDDGPTLGEDEILRLTPEDPAVTELLTRLVSLPSPDALVDLRDRKVAFIVLPAPADGAIAAVLDATAGLERASTADRDTNAWQLVDSDTNAQFDGTGSWGRIVLLVLQFLAIPVLLVWALPPLRRSRT